jgi:hypothetical protein
MTRAQVFDGHGNNLAGGTSIEGFDLRAYPWCRVLDAGAARWDGTVALAVILGDGELALSAEALARCVKSVEAGRVVALHARTDTAALAAEAQILGWCGGGSA